MVTAVAEHLSKATQGWRLTSGDGRKGVLPAGNSPWQEWETAAHRASSTSKHTERQRGREKAVLSLISPYSAHEMVLTHSTWIFLLSLNLLGNTLIDTAIGVLP